MRKLLLPVILLALLIPLLPLDQSWASFTQHDKCATSVGGGATTVSCTLAGSGVTSGDLVVAYCSNDSTQPMVVADGNGNLTALTQVTSIALTSQIFYTLSSVATGLQTYTCTFGAPTTAVARTIAVYVYGHTGSVSFDAQDAGATGISTDPLSASLNCAGGDALVFAGHSNENAATSSAETIHSVAFADVARGTEYAFWVKDFTSSFSDTATAHLSVSSRWTAQTASFVIAGAAPACSGNFLLMGAGKC